MKIEQLEKMLELDYSDRWTRLDSWGFAALCAVVVTAIAMVYV